MSLPRSFFRQLPAEVATALREGQAQVALETEWSLREHLRGQVLGEVAILELFARAPYAWVWRAVVDQEGLTLGEAVVERAIEAQPEVLPRLVKARLSTEALERLLAWALEQHVALAGGAVDSHGHAKHPNFPLAREVLQQAARDWAMPRETLRRLVSLFTPQAKVELDRAEHRLNGWMGSLLQLCELDRELLREAHEQLHGYGDTAVELMGRAEMPLECVRASVGLLVGEGAMWERLDEQEKDFLRTYYHWNRLGRRDLLMAACGGERVRDAEMRRLLLGSEDKHTLGTLFLTSQEEEERLAILRRLLVHDAKEALVILESDAGLRAHFAQADLAPLLASGNGEVRLRAIQLLSRLRQAEREPPEAASLGRSRS